MTFLTAAWECVSEETFMNCFKKAGISSESQVPSQSDDDDPFKLLDVPLEGFQDKRESPLFDFTVDGYVNVSEDDLTSETHVMADAEIIARVTQGRRGRLGNVSTKKRRVAPAFEVLRSCYLF